MLQDGAERCANTHIQIQENLNQISNKVYKSAITVINSLLSMHCNMSRTPQHGSFSAMERATTLATV